MIYSCLILLLNSLLLSFSSFNARELSGFAINNSRADVEHFLSARQTAFSYNADTMSVKNAPFGPNDSADCLVIFQEDKVAGIYYPDLKSYLLPEELREHINSCDKKEVIAPGVINAFFKDATVCLAEGGGHAILWITTSQNNIESREDSTQESSLTPQQCKATTKKGTRCKRLTTSKNGYCWQHGGE